MSDYFWLEALLSITIIAIGTWGMSLIFRGKKQ